MLAKVQSAERAMGIRGHAIATATPWKIFEQEMQCNFM
jgi:hypothetical protein